MPVHSVRHLFPQILSNGYVPIPNRDKACFMPGWNKIEVDARQAALWARQLRWPAIGLRVEPPLLVLDLDLPDAAIMKAIRKLVPARGALERIGSPPKTAFFLRMRADDEPFHELHTRRFTFAGQVKPVFAVQAFAGGGGARQFGCFGPHSHDESGAVLKTYAWVGGRSPATVPLRDLPELSRAEVAAILDAADTRLAGWPGLVVDASSTHGENAGHDQEYDLSAAMVFVDADGAAYTLEEVKAEAKARHELKQPKLRLTGSFTGDKTSSGSPRCKVHYSERNGISIVDFKTGITHRELLNPEDEELHELLAGIFGSKK